MHWLDRYSSNALDWHSFVDPSTQRQTFYRRLGVVESSFDHDGTDFEGRSDVNVLLTINIRNKLSKPKFRERLTLAWAWLRLYHVLLSGMTVNCSELTCKAPNILENERYFAIECPTLESVLQDAKDSIVFIEDFYPSVDPEEFWRHCMNTTRVIDPLKSIAKMFIFPLTPLNDAGQYRLQLIDVTGHHTTDGLTTFLTHIEWVSMLNKSEQQLLSALKSLIEPQNIQKRLPPAQESLYPAMTGSIARQRWFWAISRIFRHRRPPLPDSFPNPLSRLQPLKHAPDLEPKFDRVLDYSKKAPQFTFTPQVQISRAATKRFRRLCKEVDVSIGAGCFTLLAMVMMKLQEEINPGEQRHFTCGFPVNPRPFLAKGAPLLPSMMLAFSDNFRLPFLPSSLPLEGRFRLLARQANRQLRVYQKGTRASREQSMGLNHPSQLLPSNYISAVERLENKLPPHRKRGINPQGEYTTNTSMNLTCGVSSIGARKQFQLGTQSDLSDESKEFAARHPTDYMDLRACVRARVGECLVGSAGDDDGLYFGVSVDGNAIDEELMKKWKETMESIFEPQSKESRL